jgi:cell division ATPase FtsA
VVPADVRLLNIAIVDIGAGTSDIGISKGGSIVAYDMVMIAGDEVTEAIMKEYIVDFNTGEAVKLKLSKENEEIKFTDILGISRTYKKASVLSSIDHILESLCESIAESILRINGGPPTALFLVGGGCQVPGLCAKVAEKLKIPADRVNIGGKHPYRNIKLHSKNLLTPEYVTPLGIGATSRLTQINDLFSVTVNGEKITLPGTENIKVLDALLLAGVKASTLIGRAAAPVIYFLNDEKKTARSLPPVPGEIYVNNEPALLDSPVRQGDDIRLVFARHGIPPQLTISEILSSFGGSGLSAAVNGKPVKPGYTVKSNDRISIALISGNEFEAKTEAPAAASPGGEDNAKPKSIVRVSINENWVDIAIEKDEQPIFVDMLNYISVETHKAKGELILLLNGSPAAYTDPVFDGDKVTIKWSE